MKITSRDLLSLEKARAIISNMTMVPSVADIYRYMIMSFDLFFNYCLYSMFLYDKDQGSIINACLSSIEFRLSCDVRVKSQDDLYLLLLLLFSEHFIIHNYNISRS